MASADMETPLDGKYRPRSRRCCVIFSAAFVALLIVVLAVTIPLTRKDGHHVSQLPQGDNVVDSACTITLYPEICNATLSSNANKTDTRSLTSLAVSSAVQGVNDTMNYVLALNGTNVNVTAAVGVCSETLSDSLNQLTYSLNQLTTLNFSGLSTGFDDLKTGISAAMELHTTCIDAFQEIAPEVNVTETGDKASKRLSNAAAFVNAFAEFGTNLANWKSYVPDLPFHIPGLNRRRLLSSTVATPDESLHAEDQFPSWLNLGDRRLLAASNVKANVVVAKDGSGKYTSIQQAVDNGIYSATSRYIIYIKAGIYNEQVSVPRKAQNLVFVGDGIDKTIITGNKNVQMPGMTTFKSATVAITGPGFIGRGFTVQNTAGAAKHQAVALRVSADKVSFSLCSFDGFQDTLYSHTFRQFYRDCTISGTVDFIFGNSAAVFQTCTILAKTGLIGQQNTYTAQGRVDPNQNTGLSFQRCTFDGTSQLTQNPAAFPTYLGRPWKLYSRTVHLNSILGAVVNPAGWLPWSGNFALKTLFYGEYQSTGAGANPKMRVSWSTQISSPKVAGQFQAASFISANTWLPGTGIGFLTSL